METGVRSIITSGADRREDVSVNAPQRSPTPAPDDMTPTIPVNHNIVSFNRATRGAQHWTLVGYGRFGLHTAAPGLENEIDRAVELMGGFRSFRHWGNLTWITGITLPVEFVGAYDLQSRSAAQGTIHLGLGLLYGLDHSPLERFLGKGVFVGIALGRFQHYLITNPVTPVNDQIQEPYRRGVEQDPNFRGPYYSITDLVLGKQWFVTDPVTGRPMLRAQLQAEALLPIRRKPFVIAPGSDLANVLNLRAELNHLQFLGLSVDLDGTLMCFGRGADWSQLSSHTIGYRVGFALNDLPLISKIIPGQIFVEAARLQTALNTLNGSLGIGFKLDITTVR